LGNAARKNASSRERSTPNNRHRNKDGEISHEHGNTLIRTLRKIYGQSFAAGYSETEKLSEVLLQLNETSLSQLRRDHETGHFVIRSPKPQSEAPPSPLIPRELRSSDL
jgi:hypothetical protein